MTSQASYPAESQLVQMELLQDEVLERLDALNVRLELLLAAESPGSPPANIATSTAH
jgi:hypothetical protein